MFDERDEAEDFFTGGEFTASMRFRDRGEEVTGIVARPVRIVDVIDLQTNQPKKYPDGNPVKQAVITLQTEWRNWECMNRDKVPEHITEDDGLRTIWAKGNLGFELKKALREAGHKGAPPIGSMLKFRFDDTKPTDKPQPMKLYKVWFRPPTPESLAKVSSVSSSSGDDPFASSSTGSSGSSGPVSSARSGRSMLDSMRTQSEEAPF